MFGFLYHISVVPKFVPCVQESQARCITESKGGDDCG